MSVGGAGIYRADWSRLLFTDRIVASEWDPNAIEDPANRFADSGGGFSGGLLGGTATPDPGDARGWSWALQDIVRQARAGNVLMDLFAMAREITAPGLSSDTYVACGFANEASLNSTTVEAIGVAIVYAAATRNVRSLHLVNGVVTTNDGAAALGLRRAFFKVARRGANVRPVSHYGTGLDDSGADVSSLPSAAYDVALTGDLYWWVAFGRTAATAGAVSLAASAYFYATPPPASGLTPTL